jgi:hypothetical protein
MSELVGVTAYNDSADNSGTTEHMVDASDDGVSGQATIIGCASYNIATDGAKYD